MHSNICKNNYFHWLNDVLPKIAILKKKNLFENIDYFLVNGFQNEFQITSLKILKIEKNKLIDINEYPHILTDNLLVLDHPYLKKNFLKDINKIPYWIPKWYKKEFLNKTYKKNKKIYILRKNSSNRKILNENKLLKYLKQLSFKSYYLEDLSFNKQVRLFNRANIVIGLHGAGLTNIFFSQPSTHLIEIMFENSNNAIKNIAKKSFLKYSNIILKKNKIFSRNQDGLGFINIKNLEKVLF